MFPGSDYFKLLLKVKREFVVSFLLFFFSVDFFNATIKKVSPYDFYYAPAHLNGTMCHEQGRPLVYLVFELCPGYHFLPLSMHAC